METIKYREGFSNTTYQFSGSVPYPRTIETVQTTLHDSGEKSRHVWSKELIEYRPGDGRAVTIPIQDGPRPPVAGEPWEDRPVEGASPFYYSMTRALARLGLERDFQDFRGAYPDSFLAVAGYDVFEDAEDGQTEFQWGLVWYHSEKGYAAKCHLLQSQIDVVGAQVPYEEELCYEMHRFDPPTKISRADIPEAAISWEQAARQWRAYARSDLEIQEAQWSVLDLKMMHGSLRGDVPAPAAPTFVFNYYPGTFDTSPYQPTWLTGRPDTESRAAPLGYSFLDGVTGLPYQITSPTPPEWWIAETGRHQPDSTS